MPSVETLIQSSHSTRNAPLHIQSHTTTVYLQAALTSEHFFGPSLATDQPEIPAALNPTCSIALWPHRSLSVVSTVGASSGNSHPSTSASSPTRRLGWPWYHQDWCSPPLLSEYEYSSLAPFRVRECNWNVTPHNRPDEQ